MKFLFCGIAVAVLLLSSCHRKESAMPDILRADIDSSVVPGKDFFHYANGAWFKRNPVPETESRWGIGNLVIEEIYARLKKLNIEAAGLMESAKNSPTQRIGDLWLSAMDSASIDKMGADPLKAELDEIAAIKDMPGLVNMIVKLQTYRVTPCFEMFVAQDEKLSDSMVIHLVQGGLGLPNRDYYFNNDARTQNIRKEYVEYVGKTLSHIGVHNAGADDTVTAQEYVMALETALAKASRKLEDLRDPYANYHKTAVRDLSKLVPQIQWDGFFKNVGAKVGDSVIVGQPEFFMALGKALSTFTVETWKNYLRWQLVSNYADKIGGDFDKEHFYFYRTVLTGAKKQKPRWKRVIDYENQAIGELLGKAFVKEYFPEETKVRYQKLTDAVIEAYRNRLQHLDWMSDGTRQKALSKLTHMKKKIGYPDKWKDLSAMDISRQPFVRNAISIDRFWFNYNMKKLGKPVDREEWDMNPQEYNAYYNPSNNEIVLPAAIFTVPGYKDYQLDDALIYGYAAASTIGHELTHGFDDEGRLYDENGNLHNWWTPQDEEKFKERAQRYVRQFNQYTVLDSLHINGKASLGENIADLGGLVIALDAFKKTDEYRNNTLIAGFTPLQRYFLGYALGWLVEQRDEMLARQILTDVHAPAQYRVNGPMSNIPDFYEAFQVKPGEPLWRNDTARVVIW